MFTLGIPLEKSVQRNKLEEAMTAVNHDTEICIFAAWLFRNNHPVVLGFRHLQISRM